MKSEDAAQTILARHFDWFRNRCLPNVYFAGGECDLLVITKAGYAHEVEIKLTLSDWRADERKQKWGHPERRYIKRLWYAVPDDLVDKVPSFVTPTTGLIRLTFGKDRWQQGGRAERVHEAQAIVGAQPIKPETILHLCDNIYYKHWRRRMGEVGVVEPAELERDGISSLQLQ